MTTKKISILWLIIRNGIEKYLVKNFKIFVPSSAGNYRILGYHTLIGIKKIFPLLSELIYLKTRRPKTLSAITFSKRFKNKDNIKKIKKLFNKYRSDKSKIHNYHLIYGSLFKETNNIKKVFEIGLGTNNENLISNMSSDGKPGASARAFRDFYGKSQIYGADIDEEILFQENRIKTFHLDQTNLKSLNKVFKKIGGNIDLIIDDGLHASYANVTVIIAGLKYLKNKGYLIIEDISPVTKPIWEVIDNIIKTNYRTYFIKTKSSYVYIIQKSL